MTWICAHPFLAASTAYWLLCAAALAYCIVTATGEDEYDDPL